MENDDTIVIYYYATVIEIMLSLSLPRISLKVVVGILYANHSNTSKKNYKCISIKIRVLFNEISSGKLTCTAQIHTACKPLSDDNTDDQKRNRWPPHPVSLLCKICDDDINSPKNCVLVVHIANLNRLCRDDYYD